MMYMFVIIINRRINLITLVEKEYIFHWILFEWPEANERETLHHQIPRKALIFSTIQMVHFIRITRIIIHGITGYLL